MPASDRRSGLRADSSPSRCRRRSSTWIGPPREEAKHRGLRGNRQPTVLEEDSSEDLAEQTNVSAERGIVPGLDDQGGKLRARLRIATSEGLTVPL